MMVLWRLYNSMNPPSPVPPLNSQEAAAMQQLMGFGQMVGQLVLDF